MAASEAVDSLRQATQTMRELREAEEAGAKPSPDGSQELHTAKVAAYRAEEVWGAVKEFREEVGQVWAGQ